MVFQYPSLFAGLLALSIPIVVHLFNFRRFRRVYFSSIQFLKKIELETNKQSQLKKLLTLLFRCLALVFLVLAFVQPIIQSNQHAAVLSKSKAVSIFIDNSFSMNSVGSEAGLLELAKATAIDIIKGYPSATKFQIITNDLSGRQQHLLPKEDALKEVENIEVSSASAQLKEVFNKQKNALAESHADNKILYYVTDFQKSLGDLENKEEYEYYLIPIENKRKQNVFIDTCWFEEPMHLSGQNSTVMVRIRNSGENDYENVRLTCEVNGKIKAVTDFAIKAKTEKLDTIVLKNTETGWNKIKLALNDFPIVFDDAYYTTMEVVDKINVLHIYDIQPNKFVKAVYEKNPMFLYTSVPSDQLDYSVLSQNNLVVLDQIKSFSSGLQSELAKYVANYGNLLFVPNPNPELNSYNACFKSLNMNTIGTAAQEPMPIAQINRQEKVFSDIFSKWNKQMELPAVQQYFVLDKNSSSVQEPLMVLKNNIPLVLKYGGVLGGNIYYINNSLRPEDGGLPFSSLFAPMMYKFSVIGRSAESNTVQLGRQTGIPVSLKSNQKLNKGGKNDIQLSVVTPKASFIPAIQPMGNEVMVTIDESVKEAGFGDIVDHQNAKVKSIGINYNRNESVLEYEDAASLSEKYKGDHIHIVTEERESIGETVKSLESGTPLWKYCLMLSLLFLLAEMLVIRFYNQIPFKTNRAA